MANKPSDRNDEMTRLLAEGQAGLWLAESLILALIDASILDKDRALETIDVVIEQAMAAEGRSPEISRAAATLLSSIRTSTAAMRVDAPADGAKHGRRVHRARSS
jgi:hypothetical protein